ncbi:MAG TPA: hypothetical protein VIK71_08475 [Flavobacteriales bacterium]|jgi:hypothetical protein
MKKLIIIFNCSLALMFLQSCQRGKNADNAGLNGPKSANDSLFIINEGGHDFAIYLPKDLMIENHAEIRFNDATGDMHLKIGDKFWIITSQEAVEMDAIKKEVNENMLFTSRVVEESDNGILYQRLLPDGKAYDYNYRGIAVVNGKTYVFRTSEEGEFSRENVELMKTAIESVHHRS